MKGYLFILIWQVCFPSGIWMGSTNSVVREQKIEETCQWHLEAFKAEDEAWSMIEQTEMVDGYMIALEDVPGTIHRVFQEPGATFDYTTKPVQAKDLHQALLSK